MGPREDQQNELTLKDHHVDVSIATRCGLEVYPFDPKPEQIDIRDIAHALSMKCRFTGHTRYHYSVAQHSLLVCLLATHRGYPEHVIRQALLHDATEAYLPDVASPLKRVLWVSADPQNAGPGGSTMLSFKEAENRLQACIFEAFGLPKQEDPLIKVLDADVYRAEKWALMPEVKTFQTPKPPSDVPSIKERHQEMIKISFLDMAERLGLCDSRALWEEEKA
jgi:hypothetical protein